MLALSCRCFRQIPLGFASRGGISPVVNYAISDQVDFAIAAQDPLKPT
ncbi:MAG: hypothetical protein HC838_10570 [Spirulinaceae cyanobacterium RM2_2_10]|nr:hypothetical protein [Spirulinaceae cyanobacterium SM2_1_0]NJO20381.1 hypothetical protein [Spirulinaceae cyanobacterium RM2_2_10]